MEKQNSRDEPELRRSANEHDGDPDLEERTSPTPYAEDFGEWVADETTAPGEQRDQRERGGGRLSDA